MALASVRFGMTSWGRFRRRHLLCATLFSACTCLAFGQAQAPVIGQRASERTRTIEGTVLNKDGAPVPDARVLIKDTKTLQIRSYIAQKDGKYRFFGLSADVNYEIRAESHDMTSPTKTVSVFDSHKVVVLNLKLKKKFKAS